MTKLMLATLVSATAFSALSLPSAFAFNDHIDGNSWGIGPARVQQLVCSTPKDKFGGGETVTIPRHDEYTATIEGSINGGMAHFIENIGPYNVKISYGADSVIYSNDEEGIELVVTTTGIDGEPRMTASFKNGDARPAVSMSCHIENI